MEREAWCAVIHGVAKSRRRLSDWTELRNFPIAQMVKNLPVKQETQVRSLGQEDPLQKEMATYSSILAWSIPWTEEPAGLQSIGSQRVRRGWVTRTHTQAFPGGPVIKNLPVNAGDTDSIPWPGKIPHAMEQINPCATTITACEPQLRKPTHLESMFCKEE